MDIHRCRFVPFPPATINALAFSHSSNPKTSSPKSLRLALGRANGDVEIWNPERGNWFQESILRGGKDRSIESLAWTREIEVCEEHGKSKTKELRLRLFSIGDSPSVTEWDLATGVPVRHANGNFADIWCLAAQPEARLEASPGVNGASSYTSRPQLLAGGCSDGAIVLFTTEDNDLRFYQRLAKPPTKKPKVLSITWRDENTLVAGYDDSIIRVFDIRSRTTTRIMSLGKSADVNETYIWAVACLPDGTILSGDSTGELKIWDAKNFSLVQRIKSHRADIMDIAIAARGQTFVTVGIDRRTATYKQATSNQNNNAQRWQQILHRRYHQHDVKTTASFESKDLSVVVSGGVDTVPVVCPLRESVSENHRKLPYVPQYAQVSSAPSGRLFIGWWGREIHVWRLANRGDAFANAEFDSDEQSYVQIATILLDGEQDITSAQISSGGDFILASTTSATKLFQFRQTRNGAGVSGRTRLIALPPALQNFGSRLVRFSPNGQWMCAVRMDNTITLAKMATSQSQNERPSILSPITKLSRKPRENAGGHASGHGSYMHTISTLAFSDDSRVLAAGDLSGSIDLWLLQGHEDRTQHLSNGKRGAESDSSSNESSESESDDDDGCSAVLEGQKWIRNPQGATLPQLDSAVLILSFRPLLRPQQLATPPQLANGNIGLHATRHNPHPISHELPAHESKLFAVSASHQLVEFDVLACRLSDWSRRNPTEYLPPDLTVIKDRAMGCFWDVSASWERMWLYGPSWIFMLDVSRDLPAPRSSTSRSAGAAGQNKRKRADAVEPRRKPRNTGAGDSVHQSESYIGVGSHMHKFRSADSGDAAEICMRRSINPPPDEEDGSTDADTSALASLRRRQPRGQWQTDGQEEEEDGEMGGEASYDDDDAGSRALVQPKGTAHKQPGCWHTYRYRSILGIVPIGSSGQNEAGRAGDEASKEKEGSGSHVEVVVIERPMHQLDLPPRFDGGQHWET